MKSVETAVLPPRTFLDGTKWLRALFSFPVMLCSLLVVLAVFSVAERFHDPDMWWHLKTGEIIWNTAAIPRTDLFSFTTNNHAWTAHEWLAEVTIFAAYHLGGYTGLMLWLIVITSALLITQYSLSFLYSTNGKVALIGALIAWLFATVGLAVRPHMIGYVLMTFELLIIQLGRTRDGRWFFALPPLFALWVNCHGSFVMGLAIIGVYLFCSRVDFRAGSLVSAAWDSRRRNKLLIALCSSLAALLVNPGGVRQVLYPFDVMFKQQLNLAAVEEWQPLTITDPRGWALLACGAFLMMWPLVRRAELRLDELLLFALGFGMAVRHERMLFLFGVLAAPIITRLLSDEWDPYDPARDHPVANGILIFGAAAVAMAFFPATNELQNQVKTKNPSAAVEFIRESHLKGPMLNDYVFGGYLIWALPHEKVFIDGRTDIFEWTGVLREYGAWTLLQADPEVLLRKYNIEFCLLRSGAPISTLMSYLPGWKSIYDDHQAVIFVRNTPKK